MEQFDYELCRKRDGGKAKSGDLVLDIMGDDNYISRVRGGVSFPASEKWYPCRTQDGTYVAMPETVLKNLDPPKPELPKVDVVWRSGSFEPCLTADDVIRFNDELRRIAVDPNALTADELAEHGITIHRVLPELESPHWLINHKGAIFGSRYDTESAARRDATDWLRKEGKIQ